MILESKNFNQMKKQGVRNPFEQKDRVVICSYNFAAQKQSEVSRITWDLVVIDEAHRLSFTGLFGRGFLEISDSWK
jgi:SNF2 family DNA or RNA helicase